MIEVGILLSILGFLIRFISCFYLNNNFRWRLSTPSNLVTTGIYRITRHPMYLGSLIMFGGMILASTGNIWLSLTIVYFMIGFYADRIDREENILFSVFGEEFMKYHNKTPMLLPNIFLLFKE